VMIHRNLSFFTQPIDAIDITKVTLRRLNSVNAIDVNKVKSFVGAYLPSFSGHFSSSSGLSNCSFC